MIKVISFDLDGTLVKSTYPDSVWLEGVPRIYAKEKGMTINQAKEHLFKEYELVSEHRKEWYDINWWFEKFKLKESWQDLLERYKDKIELFFDSLDVIKSLHNEYELIITSNAKKEFIDIQLKQTGLDKYFKCVFSSLSDFDQVKKYPEVYQKICNIVGIKNNEMIHVGDKKEFDYLCPKKIGITSFYLDRKRNESGKNIVHNLYEFEEIIKLI